MSTQILARAFVLVALSVALAIMVTAIQVSEAHAQDMSAQLEEYNAECFDSASGEFLGTDGCFEWAEQHIELENLLESIEKGCTLTDMYEDYSCKGPQGPTSSSSSSVSEQGCTTVDMTDPQVSGEDIDVLTKYFGFDAKADNDDQLYSPECFEQGIVEWDWDAMVNNPCYDVLGNSEGETWVEYIGCPSASEQPYTPLTQQGTPAPADWRSHVVPLKPAASSKLVKPSSKASSTKEATTSTPVKTVAYVEHDPRDTGRSQGQVVSESKRTEAHAAATKVQAKLAATEKAKKARSKEK